MTIRAAVIGLGWWGRHITKVLRDSPILRVTHGFDSVAQDVSDFANQHGLALAGSFEAILKDGSIDAVVLATPHSLHESQAVAVIASGKPLFCEKPLALSVRGARRILELCEGKGFVLGIGHERRFEPAMEEALAILRSGRHGLLLHMEANVSHDALARLDPGNWRHNPSDAPAGVWTGLGVHLSDLFVSFAGRPVSVRARTAKKTRMPGAEDYVSCDLTFASGATGSITCLSATPYYGRLTVFGEKGWLEVRENGNVDLGMPSEIVVCDAQGGRTIKSFPAAPTVRANLEAWALAIGDRAGAANYRFTPTEILDNIRILEGVVLSSRSASSEIALDSL
jgi:predicted dehydrogenase